MRRCLVCGQEFESTGRGRPPETCSPEHQAIRKMEQRMESRERAMQRGMPEGKEVHGTSTGYTYYGCTCGLCRRWAREYKQTRRKVLAHEGESSDE